MSDTRLAELAARRRTVEQMPFGAARIVATEKLWRQVEAEGPDAAWPTVLGMLVEAYVWGQESVKAFVPFTRWLRLYDERPELFDDETRHKMFWSFRWMAARSWAFPEVPYEQIDSVLADMERRYAQAGLAMDAVRLDQFHWAWVRNLPEVEERFWRWVHTPRRDEDTCLACDASGEGTYLFETGRPEQAARRLEQALDEGLRCATEPGDMLATLAECYVVLGRAPEAAHALRRSIAFVEGAGSPMAAARGRHVRVLARGGQHEHALRRLEASAHLLTEGDTPESRLWFLVDVAGATRLVARERPELPVRMAGVPVRTAAELAAWVEQEARPLAEAFDARNRGTRYLSALAEALSWEPAPVPLDLSVLPVHQDGEPFPVAEEAFLEDEAGQITDFEALQKVGQQLVRHDDAAQVARLFLRTAQRFAAEGKLEDAGLAEVNAGRFAHLLQDVAGADAAIRHGLGLLRAGGAAPDRLSRLTRAWIPVALDAGSIEDALAELVATRTALAPLAAAPEAESVRAEVAESLDTHARALATLGRHAEAARLGEEAARSFAAGGRVKDAAHSFWLVGKALVAEGRDEEAVFHLESAVEGFGMTRAPVPRAKAASELVEVLRRLGRTEQADVVAAELGV